jgi:hypothetical protein
MKLEKGRYYKALVSINALKDSMEDVTEQFRKPEQLHIFPTDEEWERFADDQPSNFDVYEWFKSRIQPLEIGKDCECSVDGIIWYKQRLLGYSTCDSDGHYTHRHIRPIQPAPNPTREAVLEDLKKFREGNNDAVLLSSNTIDAVIKLLEGSR